MNDTVALAHVVLVGGQLHDADLDVAGAHGCERLDVLLHALGGADIVLLWGCEAAGQLITT